VTTLGPGAAAASLDAALAGLDDDYEPLSCDLMTPPEPEARGASSASADAQPLVSCLMVTRGELSVLQFAVECFRRQSWPRRELVVVTGADRAAEVDAYLERRGVRTRSVTGAPPGLQLGDLRNMALARATGDIVMTWDDDDLYDPHRVRTVATILRGSRAAAIFLPHLLLWWPARRMAAISARRLWEGSVALWRDRANVYPALARGEDSPFVDNLALTHPIALLNAPLQYVYAVTGRNTWTASHFNKLFSDAEHPFTGSDYDRLMQALARRMPIREYAASLEGSGSGPSAG
jgi:glycosyltransferase involved in cell wall biosynthesis